MKETQKGLLNTVVTLFAIGLLIGCIALFMAIINCMVLLPQRREIAAASPVHFGVGLFRDRHQRGILGIDAIFFYSEVTQ